MKLQVKRYSTAYWRVTIDNPPYNVFDKGIADELTVLIDRIEEDDDVKVVVFESANPDYFLTHPELDKLQKLKMDQGPTGLTQWLDFSYRIERVPFITVGLIRGRVSGMGNEFALALDMRFASREKAIFSQVEVANGIIPGGGALERLPLLIGRARALEAIIGADDFDADTAERYGWINRSMPDAQLNDFVGRFAQRVAGFDRKVIGFAKEIITKRTEVAKRKQLASTQEKFYETLVSPETQAKVAALKEQELQQRNALEEKLGQLLGSE